MRALRMRVMVVDDALTVRMLAEMLLKQAGYDVVTAADGRSALTLAAATVIDVVVLDVEMPGMSGLDTCRQLRAQGLRTPVILLTTSNERGELSTLEPFTSTLKKPFVPEALLASIADALSAESEAMAARTHVN
jgi:CheY-like chemotaxis protein